MADLWTEVVRYFEQRDAKTAAQHGCPLATTSLDGDPSCERADGARIALAVADAHAQAAVAAAGPLLLKARRHATGGRLTIDVTPEEFHVFREAIDRLRASE